MVWMRLASPSLKPQRQHLAKTGKEENGKHLTSFLGDTNITSYKG